MKVTIQFLGVAAIVLGISTRGFSDEPVGTPEDRRAILENLEDTVRSINQRDPVANGAVFTEDGDHINPFGVASKGPKEIGAMIQKAFHDFPDWKARCEQLEVRFLTPEVAIQLREWSDVSEKESKFPEKSPEIVVLIKRSGKWGIIAARPMIGYNTNVQKDLEAVPNAAGFSDPQFANEVAGWPKDLPVCEKAVAIDVSGHIHRNQQIAKYDESLKRGRTRLEMKVNSARRISNDVAIVDYGFADTGDWKFLDGTTAKGTYRGLWFAVYRKHDGKWTLEASQAMFPFIGK